MSPSATRRPRRWAARGDTDVGLVRARNEDTFAIDDGLGCYLVADGLGGHAGGDVASAMARDTVLDVLRRAPERLRADAGEALARAARQANAAIHHAAQRDRALAGMATTLSLLWLDREAPRGCLAHVGDSRAYRLDRAGLVQIGEDHTRAAELVRAGVLAADEAARSPARHQLLRAVGLDDEVAVDIAAFGTAGAAAFLLCSDGLTGMVDDARIEKLLRAHADDARAASAALIDAALGNGGSDNVTVVVIQRRDG